ncbi:TonB-dependent receptor [Sphingomonas sp. So64.6b]|uniref:TonB-dependent receptor n=1 Tax=Sphingomonas sp. So64.6b TaxID=2997354 RepID=UPI0016046799|nr:TonB-dependent receptor [Sphingomonas sp. So64.6b]QNA84184.1 TonB-dependent receptor [Sphingomonas sp. So64.6b]
MKYLFLLGAASAALVPAAAQAQQAAPATPPAVSSDTDQQTDQRGDQHADQHGDVIVTALPFGAETPTIASRVNRNDILTSGGSSIADALANVPGISATGFAPGASRPIIRGQDATRVRVLENGSSSSDVSDIGPDHGMPIDPLSARSIEVVRGAAALRYGSQAIGGVVNVVNNRVPMTLPTRDLSGELTGAFDSVSNTGEGTALMDGRAGDIAVHADGFYRDAGDYDTPLGRQGNSFFRGYGETVGASYFFGADKDSHVGAAIEQYNAKYGIPSDTTYIDMRQTKVLTRGSFALGGGALQTLNVDGSYADYTHDEDDPDGTILTTFRNKEADGHAELVFGALGPVANSALGVEIQHRDFQALGEDSSYLFPTTTDTQAAYLFTDTPIGDALHLQASGRVEHVHVAGTPASDAFTTRDYTPLSGSVGALYNIGAAVKLGFNASSTGRAPAITELFARGGHDGPNTFETGDPTLKIERSNSLEATLRVNTSRFSFEGSLYSSWFKNYIFGQLTGRSCDDDGVCADGDSGELRELNYRQQGAWFRGVEAQAHFDIVKTDTTRFAIRALADYTRATLDGDGNVPRIPPYRAGGGFDYQSPKIDAGVLFVHSGRQDKYGAFDTPTPGYNQLTAQISLRPLSAHPGVQLSLVGQNLTNDIQRNAAALNRDDVVLPGRNIRLVLKLATF